MLTGDLCVMITQCRSTAAPFTTHVPCPADQNWVSETLQNGTTISTQLHWCTFNGTWSSNPAGFIAPSTRAGMMSGCGKSLGDTTIPFSVILLVFRPVDTSKTWAIDVAKASATYAAPTTPFTVTRTTCSSPPRAVFRGVSRSTFSISTESASPFSAIGTRMTSQ